MKVVIPNSLPYEKTLTKVRDVLEQWGLGCQAELETARQIIFDRLTGKEVWLYSQLQIRLLKKVPGISLKD